MDENNRQTLVITFSITSRLRYLSHAETARMFERAMIRAGVNIRYSQGFNPHPRMSLPLPRTVGVGSVGDVLSAEMIFDDSIEAEQLIEKIQKQLPCGCCVDNIEIVNEKASLKPVCTDYEFAVDRLNSKKEIVEKIEQLQRVCADGHQLVIKRWSRKKNRYQDIDASSYIQEISTKGDVVTVKVNITQQGSIRVEEILELAGVRTNDIPSGVTRRNTVFAR